MLLVFSFSFFLSLPRYRYERTSQIITAPLRERQSDKLGNTLRELAVKTSKGLPPPRPSSPLAGEVAADVAADDVAVVVDAEELVKEDDTIVVNADVEEVLTPTGGGRVELDEVNIEEEITGGIMVRLVVVTVAVPCGGVVDMSVGVGMIVKEPMLREVVVVTSGCVAVCCIGDVVLVARLVVAGSVTSPRIQAWIRSVPRSAIPNTD